MYNPYMAEEFEPLEDVSSLDSGGGASDFMSEFSLEDMEGKLSALRQFGKLKDMVKVEHLSFLGDLFGKKKGGSKEEMMSEVSEGLEGEGFFSKVKEKLHLEKLDTGDVLLIIIVIYLMLDGEDTLELAITLGILAFLWWSDSKKEET